MSTYNEYLHGDFKRLDFSEYIKMLDSETHLKNFSFLSTTEKLEEPPFFGKYIMDYHFTIVNPAESTGKRPYIGLIQATLVNEKIDNQQNDKVTQVFYPPIPNRHDIRNMIINKFQARAFPELPLSKKMDHEDIRKRLQLLSKRHRRR